MTQGQSALGLCLREISQRWMLYLPQVVECFCEFLIDLFRYLLVYVLIRLLFNSYIACSLSFCSYVSFTQSFSDRVVVGNAKS